MPFKEKEITKLYYSIGEAAAMFGLTVAQLRNWEKEFDVLQPRKNKKGNRQFTNQDLEVIKLIHNLLKEQQLTLEGAKKYLRENKSTVLKDVRRQMNKNRQIAERLQKIKKKLLDLIPNLK